MNLLQNKNDEIASEKSGIKPDDVFIYIGYAMQNKMTV